MNMEEKDDVFGLLNARRLNGTAEGGDEIVTSNDSDIIRLTLRVYGSIYLACLVLFAVLRKKYPRLFNIRSWAREMKCDLALKKYGWINWFWEPFKVSDDDLLLYCGFDAMAFIRALRFGRKLTLFASFHSLWLIPLYRTAVKSDETDYLTDPLVRITVSNVPSFSYRFIGTVIAAYFLHFYAMHLTIKEYKWYTMWRHKFLAREEPRSYSVYVSGIPEMYQSNRELEKYFQQCSSAERVVETHVAMDTPKLDAKVARRKRVIQLLEHAVALEKRTGEIETHIKFQMQHGVSVQKVESVAEYESELDELNRSISRSIHEIKGTGDDLRTQLQRYDGTLDLLSAVSEETHQDNSLYVDFGSGQLDTEQIVGLRQNDRLSVEPEASTFDIERQQMSFMNPDHTCDTSDVAQPSLSFPNHTMPDGIPDDAQTSISEPDRPAENAEADFTDDLTSISEPDRIEAALDDSLLGHDKEENTELLMAGKGERQMSLGASALGPKSRSSRSRFSSRHSMTSSSANSSRLSMDSSERSAAIRDSLRRSVVTGSKVVTESIELAGSSIATGSRLAKETIVKGGLAAGSTIAKGSRVAGAQAEKIIQTAGDKSAETLKKAQVVGNHLVTSAGAVVPILINKSEGAPQSAAFVSFADLYTTQTALEMIHHPEPWVFDVQPAPEPKSIFWRNVGLPARARRTGLIASVAATAAICLFWSIPMAFVSSLTELNSLKNTLPKLGEWLDNHPSAEMIVAQLAPLLLLFLNETILPSVLKYFSAWEGHVSSAVLESSLFLKLGSFMIIQTFFVSAISGSVTAEIRNMLQNTEEILTFLANSLPAQSSYFIQIALAQTFFLQSIEVLRAYPLGLALLRRFMGPRLTAKERRRPWGWISSLDEPPDFWHAETFAQLVLFFVVAFVYSPIAPITPIFLCFCFILLESGYRYQFIHNYPFAFDTGGQLWKHFIQFSLASMVIAQLTLIGVLILKQSPYAGPLLGPLLAITILFIMYINSKPSLVAEYLPTRDCILKDSENAAEGEPDLGFLKEAYLQPSLQTKNIRLQPDFDEGVDDYLQS